MGGWLMVLKICGQCNRFRGYWNFARNVSHSINAMGHPETMATTHWVDVTVNESADNVNFD